MASNTTTGPSSSLKPPVERWQSQTRPHGFRSLPLSAAVATAGYRCVQRLRNAMPLRVRFALPAADMRKKKEFFCISFHFISFRVWRSTPIASWVCAMCCATAVLHVPAFAGARRACVSCVCPSLEACTTIPTSEGGINCTWIYEPLYDTSI